jgi:hypothetical protein
MKFRKLLAAALCFAVLSQGDVNSRLLFILSDESFGGCASIPNSSAGVFHVSSHVFWVDDVTDVRSICENEDSVFYISSTGIIQFDKATNSKVLIIKTHKLAHFKYMKMLFITVWIKWQFTELTLMAQVNNQ